MITEWVDRFGVPLEEKLVLKSWDEYAVKVAEAYDARPSMESEHVPSWNALIQHIEKMFAQMKSKVSVEFVPEDPYASEREIAQDIEKNKRLKVYSGHAKHPIWTEEQNLKFRAYHDFLSHVPGGHSFGMKGEIAAYNQHVKMVPPKALLALFTEVVGQVMSALRSGKFPEQKICKLHGFDYINVGKIDEEEYKKNFVIPEARQKKDDMTGITTKKLRELERTDFYNADTGLELDPDEARAELLKRYTEMQDELIKKYKKGSRV